MDKESILIEIEKQTLDIQQKSFEKLTAIHKWVVFFGAVTIISLVAGLISVFAVLSNID